MKKLKHIILATMLAAPMAANSAAITYKLDAEFSNSGYTPSGPLLVTFDDGGTAGSVTMTIDATGLSTGEHVKNLYINIDDAIGPFDVNGGINGASDWMSYALYKDADKTDLNDGTNLKADGIGGYFDMKFDLSFGGGNGMGAGNKFIYDFVGPNSLVASSFAFSSFGGTGELAPYEIAAHIGGLGDRQEGSGWVTVPAPASVLLMGLGLAMIGARKLKK